MRGLADSVDPVGERLGDLVEGVGSQGAPTSAERLFCHVYGRAKNQPELIPGWPYSFVAALEPGRTSWTAVLDAVRLGPTDDATAVTAGQLRAGAMVHPL